MGAILWTQLPWSPRVTQQGWLCPESCLCVQHSPACPGFLTELQTCCFHTEGLKEPAPAPPPRPIPTPNLPLAWHPSDATHIVSQLPSIAPSPAVLQQVSEHRRHLSLPQPPSPQIMGKAHPHRPLPKGNQLLRKDSLLRVETT